MDTLPDNSDLATRIAQLADALARQTQETQALEGSLVARIADVDDDRRLTTNRLQRAWQTQREEIEARLKRQVSRFMGALLLLAVVLGGILFFVYGQLDATRRAMNDELAQLRLDYQRLMTISAQDAALQASIGELRAAVAAMSESLGRDGVEIDTSATTPLGTPVDPAVDAPTAAPSAVASVTIAPDTLHVTPGPPDTTDPTPAPTPDTATTPDRTRAETTPPGSVPEEAGTPPPSADHTVETEAAAAAPTDAPEVEPRPVAPQPEPAPPPEEPEPKPTEPETQPQPTTPTETTATDSTPVTRIAEARERVGARAFALQLIGFYSLDELQAFARREPLPPRVYFREESYQGRPWFVLIHSLHEHHGDAAAVAARLPSALGSLDLWIRRLPAETELGIIEIER